jgi:hypothetical protein
MPLGIGKVTAVGGEKREEDIFESVRDRGREK